MEEMKDLVHGQGVNPWVYSTCVFALTLLILVVLRRLAWARLRAWSARSDGGWGEALLDSIAFPATILLFILAFGIAGQSAPLLIRTHPLMVHGVKVAMIISVVWLLERAMTETFRSKALPEAVSTTTRALFMTIGRAVLLVLGFLIILDTIGVSITPILASLGVGSVAVALALQDTLSNFFGGLYILVDKPIRIGDTVKVQDAEGTVERIGWRSTRIRTGTNDTVIVPNSKVASAELRNFDLPSPTTLLLVPCSVAYGSDLVKVEEVTVQVARQVVGRVSGGDASFQPLVRYNAFGDNAITFTIVLQITRYGDGGTVKHELIKALHRRFQSEGIEIPFPQRVIHWNPGAPPESPS